MLVLPGNGQNILIGCCAEHHQLTIRIGALNDLLHVLDKAHLQHLIRFVKHHGVNAGQLDIAALHVIQQSSRRCNQKLRFTGERIHLLAKRLSTVDHGNLQPFDEMRKIGQLVADLLRQLTRWSQNDLLNARIVQIDILKHRDTEAEGLAGAGRRNGDDVMSIHHQRNALFLNSGKTLETHPVKGTNNFVADAHFDKLVCMLYFAQNSIPHYSYIVPHYCISPSKMFQGVKQC